MMNLFYALLLNPFVIQLFYFLAFTSVLNLSLKFLGYSTTSLPFLLFLMLFPFRVLKWCGLSYETCLFLDFFFVLLVLPFLNVIVISLFNHWFIQRVIAYFLKLENNFYEYPKITFFLLSSNAFCIGAYWVIFDYSAIYFLFFSFLIGFYFHFKKMIFGNILLIEWKKEKNFLGNDLTWDDIISLMNYISLKEYNSSIINQMPSSFGNKSFPYIGKRFVSNLPKGPSPYEMLSSVAITMMAFLGIAASAITDQRRHNESERNAAHRHNESERSAAHRHQESERRLELERIRAEVSEIDKELLQIRRALASNKEDLATLESGSFFGFVDSSSKKKIKVITDINMLQEEIDRLKIRQFYALLHESVLLNLVSENKIVNIEEVILKLDKEKLKEVLFKELEKKHFIVSIRDCEAFNSLVGEELKRIEITSPVLKIEATSLTQNDFSFNIQIWFDFF